MTDPLGYLFGYGSLAGATDPLVSSVATERDLVYGRVEGFRRRWNTAMENAAPLNDHAYYVDPATGERLDICVVALNIQPGDGIVNGVAVPVGTAELPAFDRRELHYDRIDVSDSFSPRLDLPVWSYVANAQALREFGRWFLLGSSAAP